MDGAGDLASPRTGDLPYTLPVCWLRVLLGVGVWGLCESQSLRGSSLCTLAHDCKPPLPLLLMEEPAMGSALEGKLAGLHSGHPPKYGGPCG